MGEINYIVLTATILVLSAVIYFNYKRHNKIQNEVGRLITEARRLNKNIEVINKNLNRNAKKSGKVKILQPICKNCVHRQTYLYPDSPNDFFYECKLNRDSITLTDTCDKFQDHLQNKQI